MITAIIIGSLVALVVFFVIFTYNIFVRLTNAVDNAWANIDVLLKQRFDELPNLVSTVKAYTKHEKELFERIAQLRSEYVNCPTLEGKGDVATQASSTIRSLFAVAERYPELKANENFLALQKRISELEDMIADRREYYNETVRIYNTRILQIPYVFVARLGSFAQREHFSFKDRTEAVTVEI